MDAAGTTNILGTTSVVVIGPAPDLVLAAGNVTDVKDYLCGTGLYSAEGGQVTANVHPDDINAFAATAQTQDVILATVLGTGYSFPWTGTATTDTGCTTTNIIVVGSLPVGLSINTYVAIRDTSQRGGYAVRKVTAVNGGLSSFTIDSPMAIAPSAGVTVRPAPANWAAMRDAVLAVFDSLGPGDSVYPSKRWPAESTSDTSILYRSAVVAAAMGVPGLAGAPAGVSGVTSVSVTLVGAGDPEKVTPAAKVLLTPGEIRITP
jgi:hypothetical protein